MTKKRKYPTAEEKALILKRYLVEKVPSQPLGNNMLLENGVATVRNKQSGHGQPPHRRDFLRHNSGVRGVFLGDRIG